MRIKTIRVSAGRTIPHPHESYSNMKFFVELTAEIKATEDAARATARLQIHVDEMLSMEVALRLSEIEAAAAKKREEREAEMKKQQILRDAERAIREAEHRLECIRKGVDPDEIPF